MADVSLNLRFWLSDGDAKKFVAGGYSTKGVMLARLMCKDIDGDLDSMISYGELKVKMDDSRDGDTAPSSGGVSSAHADRAAEREAV